MMMNDSTSLLARELFLMAVTRDGVPKTEDGTIDGRVAEQRIETGQVWVGMILFLWRLMEAEDD